VSPLDVLKVFSIYVKARSGSYKTLKDLVIEYKARSGITYAKYGLITSAMQLKPDALHLPLLDAWKSLIILGSVCLQLFACFANIFLAFGHR
jgi:hypothetical protein